MDLSFEQRKTWLGVFIFPFFVFFARRRRKGFFMSGNERFLKKKLWAVSVFLSCSLIIHPVFAASVETAPSSAPDSNDKAAPPITTVVSANRREVPIEKTTRSVTVITRGEIEKSGKVYLLDLLRGVPGVTIVQRGTFGRESQISIRGMNNESTLVMMDGVQINNSNQSVASLQHITTADIERIEIIRGPQSVLYGADAAGGMVHIITKAEKAKGIHGAGRFEYGTYRSFYEEAKLSGGWDQFSISGAGGRMDTDGLSENDDYENTTYRGHAQWQATENSNLDVSFHHFNSIVGIDDGVISGAFRTDPNRNTRANQQVLNTRYTVQTAEWWQQYVQYSLFHDKSFSHDPRNPELRTGSDPESFLSINSNRHTFEYQSDFYIQDFDVITVGYEFEHSGVHTTNNTSLARNHGWFGQNELTLWEIWTLVAGVRLDNHELYGFEASPLFSTGLWIAQTQTKLKSSFGKGFRAPTFNQLFFPNFGNPNLAPETTWAWDGGFEQFYLDQRGTFSATYFNSRTRNLIANLAVATNIGSARSQGMELENRFKIWKDLSFNTNYTYTHSIDRASDKRLQRVPRHQGKVGFSYDYQRLHGSADLVWVGSREDSNAVRLHEYMRLDMALFYDLTDFLQIYGRIENATNDEYFDAKGFDMPHTGFYSGIKGDF
jgi:vitamin B12 transporter